jgi:hypothetical protein
MSEFLLQLRWRGRFGNRLFQYAYGATYARVTGLKFWIPATRLFRHQPHRVVEHNDIRQASCRRRCRTGYVENLDDGKLCWASRAIYNWRRFARPTCGDRDSRNWVEESSKLRLKNFRDRPLRTGAHVAVPPAKWYTSLDE